MTTHINKIKPNVNGPKILRRFSIKHFPNSRNTYVIDFYDIERVTFGDEEDASDLILTYKDGGGMRTLLNEPDKVEALYLDLQTRTLPIHGEGEVDVFELRIIDGVHSIVQIMHAPYDPDQDPDDIADKVTGNTPI